MTWRNTSDLVSVPPENFITFSDVQTVVLKKVFLSLRQNAISHATKCDKMRYQCDKMRYRILSHFVACDITAHWCFIIVLPTLVSIGISCIPRRFDVTNATNCSAGEGAISPHAHHTRHWEPMYCFGICTYAKYAREAHQTTKIGGAKASALRRAILVVRCASHLCTSVLCVHTSKPSS
jgi:hypothetical protein